MNLYALSKRFWQLHEQEAFQPTDTHLYWLLVNAFNARGDKGNWPELITYTDGVLADVAGINRKTLWPSRDRLVERGLIVISTTGIGKRTGTEYRLTCPKTGQLNGQVNGQIKAQPVQQVVQKPDNLTDNLPIYIESIPQTPDRKDDDDDACARTYEAEEVPPIHPAVARDREGLTAFEGEKEKSPPGSAPPPHDPPDPAQQLTAYHERISSDRQWIEAALITFKTKPADLATLLHEFTIEQTGFEKTHDDYNDYRKHAHAWIRKRINDNANNTNHSANAFRSKRRSHTENFQEFSEDLDRIIAERYGA